MLNTGEEPYRAVGVDVNEAEILDVAARAQVSKAQDQYSKMYREAHSILHCLGQICSLTSWKQAYLPTVGVMTLTLSVGSLSFKCDKQWLLEDRGSLV